MHLAGITELYFMMVNAIIDRIYRQPWLRIVLHCVFWTIFLGMKVYVTGISFNVYRSFPAMHIVMLDAASTACIALFYYVLVYFLLPARRASKRNLLRFLGIPVLFLLYALLDTYLEIYIIQTCSECMLTLKNENPVYYDFINRGVSAVLVAKVSGLGSLLLLLFVLCVPFSIKLLLRSVRSEMKAARLAKDNLQLEFNFLKAQLHPHFLFNTMNNIYGLILQGDNARSAALVAKLSALLRYILYESDQHTVRTEKEIQLTKDFIELEKVRLNYIEIDFACSVDNKATEIAPLLLMPLVENAFKHSADSPGSYIHIILELRQGRLSFSIKNTLGNSSSPDMEGGIGLRNFIKRLDLYYEGRYSYRTEMLPTVYSVNLIIEL